MDLNEFLLQNDADLLSCLDPYQQDLVTELLKVSDGNCVLAADKWLSASFSNTVAFGGSNKSLIYREKLFEEIELFICGCDDGKYQNEREKITQGGDVGKKFIISTISAAIGANLGVSGAYIAPAIILLLQSLGKIVINAWCETRKALREKK